MEEAFIGGKAVGVSLHVALLAVLGVRDWFELRLVMVIVARRVVLVPTQPYVVKSEVVFGEAGGQGALGEGVIREFLAAGGPDTQGSDMVHARLFLLEQTHNC